MLGDLDPPSRHSSNVAVCVDWVLGASFFSDGGELNVNLQKMKKADTWPAALQGSNTTVDPLTLEGMQKKIMLERFQSEVWGVYRATTPIDWVGFFQTRHFAWEMVIFCTWFRSPEGITFFPCFRFFDYTWVVLSYHPSSCMSR